MKRRSLMMPEELWSMIRQQAAAEQLATGEAVSASDVVRRASALYCSAGSTAVDYPGGGEGAADNSATKQER